jgi:hypothetical protein
MLVLFDNETLSPIQPGLDFLENGCSPEETAPSRSRLRSEPRASASGIPMGNGIVIMRCGAAGVISNLCHAFDPAAEGGEQYVVPHHAKSHKIDPWRSMQ